MVTRVGIRWSGDHKYTIRDEVFPTYEEAKAFVFGFEAAWLESDGSYEIETKYGKSPLGADVEVIVS